MNRVVLIGAGVLLLFAVDVTLGRPEGAPLAEYPSSPTSTSTVPAKTDGVSPDSTTSTAAPEESKFSKFFDDVSTVFKQGTSKVKEGWDSATASVKDGVMRGYDYVKDKFTGNGDAVTTQGSPTSTAGSDPSTSTTSEKKVPSVKSIGVNSAPASPSTTKPVRVEPNDEGAADDDRLIFIGDEDTATDLTPNTTPKPSITTAKTGNLDDRFILDGPVACPKGQTAVNGVCRNTF